jgi:outer membrane protein OmpA-like peptidoglycan-associated protein
MVGMRTHPRSLALLLGLALVPACAGTNADKTRPVAEEPSQPAAAPTAANTRSETMSGVYLDPEIARLCGMASPAAYFEFDSAAVEGADNSGLLTLAACLSSGPLKGRQIQLVGHTDPRGSEEHNIQLGKTRADSVMQFLANEGAVPADRMKTLTEGEKGADPGDAAEWPYDRRVEIRLVP